MLFTWSWNWWGPEGQEAARLFFGRQDYRPKVASWRRGDYLVRSADESQIFEKPLSGQQERPLLRVLRAVVNECRGSTLGFRRGQLTRGAGYTFGRSATGSPSYHVLSLVTGEVMFEGWKRTNQVDDGMIDCTYRRGQQSRPAGRPVVLNSNGRKTTSSYYSRFLTLPSFEFLDFPRDV